MVVTQTKRLGKGTKIVIVHFHKEILERRRAREKRREKEEKTLKNFQKLEMGTISKENGINF